MSSFPLLAECSNNFYTLFATFAWCVHDLFAMTLWYKVCTILGYTWIDVPSSSSGIILGSPVSPSSLDSPSSSRGANLVVCPQDVSPAIITREYPPNPTFNTTGKASAAKKKGAFNVVNIKQEKQDPLLSTAVADSPGDPLGFDAELPGNPLPANRPCVIAGCFQVKASFRLWLS